jgi:hypothetical protein
MTNPKFIQFTLENINEASEVSQNTVSRDKWKQVCMFLDPLFAERKLSQIFKHLNSVLGSFVHTIFCQTQTSATVPLKIEGAQENFKNPRRPMRPMLKYSKTGFSLVKYPAALDATS